MSGDDAGLLVALGYDSGMDTLTPLALRLTPGQDLKETLAALVLERAITAGVVVTCVGSLSEAALRLANQPKARLFRGPFEIVSLTGTLSPNGLHLHMSIADRDGHVTGGHVQPGCRIYTTAEIVLGVLSGMTFSRELDSATGYKELRVLASDKQTQDA